MRCWFLLPLIVVSMFQALKVSESTVVEGGCSVWCCSEI